MELSFTISTERVLRECIAQTSLDLQAIRARGNELSAAADTIYTDWTMNEDNRPEIYTPLEGIGAKLCQRLKRYILGYSYGLDVTSIQLCVSNIFNGVDAVLESALLHFYKYSLLSWWYTYRDSSLASFYQEAADGVLRDIEDSVFPQKSRIIPHYF